MYVILGQIQAHNSISCVQLVTHVTLVQRFKANSTSFVKLALGVLKELDILREIDLDVSQVFTVLLDLYPAHQRLLNVHWVPRHCLYLLQ